VNFDLFLGERIVPKSAKELRLHEISVDKAMMYNAMWHSRLPVTSHSNMIRNTRKIFYGAEYDGHCFASAMWSDPVANNRLSKAYVWLELRRLAIAPDAPKFTATWMIAKMIKDIKKKFPEVTRLVSYQDTEVHTGTIYSAANWKKDAVSTFQEWTTGIRKRNDLQTKSDKIRWIYELGKANEQQINQSRTRVDREDQGAAMLSLWESTTI
jgi:hypothetical protein